MKYQYSFSNDFVMDDVSIARPFETDPCIFCDWHMYSDATFIITACIPMINALVIYVAHR